MDVGFELELLPGRFWNSKSSHRGFAFGSKSCHRRLSLSLSKLLCVGCSSESKEVSVWDSSFFYFSSVDELESFVFVFDKSLEIIFFRPKNPPLALQKFFYL